MIRSFHDTRTEALFNDRSVLRFRSIERPARRKLLFLHHALRLKDLRVPPGNRLEALKGERKGQQYPHQRSMADLLSLGKRRCL